MIAEPLIEAVPFSAAEEIVQERSSPSISVAENEISCEVPSSINDIDAVSPSEITGAEFSIRYHGE